MTTGSTPQTRGTAARIRRSLTATVATLATMATLLTGGIAFAATTPDSTPTAAGPTTGTTGGNTIQADGTVTQTTANTPVNTITRTAQSTIQTNTDPGTPGTPGTPVDGSETATITIGADQDTTLDGLTVEYRKVGMLTTEGGVNATDQTVMDAARTVGGTGTDPMSSLFRNLVTRTQNTPTAAKALYDAVKTRPADHTSIGQGQVTLPVGWYTVNVKDQSDSEPTLVVAGTTKHEHVSQAMLSGVATLTGKPQTAFDQNLQADSMSLFAMQPRDVPYINDTVYMAEGGIKWGKYNTADYRWRSANDGVRQAFCMDPDAKNPDPDQHVNTSVLDDPGLKAILFYGYNGPASIFTNTQGTWGVHVDASHGDQVWATHLAIAVRWQNRPRDTQFKYANGPANLMIGVNQLLDLAEQHPLSPVINFTAWRLDPANGHQNLVGWTFNVTRIDASTDMIRGVNNGDVKKDRKLAIQDVIHITPRDGGWSHGEQLLVCTDLLYDDTPDGLRPDGGRDAQVDFGLQMRTKCVVANPANDVPRDTNYDVWSQWFIPGDFGWAQWPAGRYWMSTYFDTHHSDRNSYPNEKADEDPAHNPKFAHIFNFENFRLDGRNDGREGMTLMEGSGVTMMHSQTSGTDPVWDDLKLTSTPRFNSGTNWGGYTGNRQLTVTVRLNYLPAGKDNVLDNIVKSDKTQCVWSDTGDPCDIGTNGAGTRATFTPGDVGLKTWDEKGGKFWFDQHIAPQDDWVSQLDLWGEHADNENWEIKPLPTTFTTQAKGTFTQDGGSNPVYDTVTGTNPYSDPNLKVNAHVTLNWTDNPNGTTAKKSKQSPDFTVPANGNADSPKFTPQSLDPAWTTWKGGRYWFDLTIPKNQPALGSQNQDRTYPGLKDPAEQWITTTAKLMTLTTTSQAVNGLASQWDTSDVTDATRFTARTTKDNTTGIDTNIIIEGDSTPLTDQVRLHANSIGEQHHDWDANQDQRFDQNVLVTVQTTLHTPMGASTKTQDYDSYWSTSLGGCNTGVASGCRAFTWTPRDFNTDTWKAGDYWFTSKVTGLKNVNLHGATCPTQATTGFLAVTNQYRLCVQLPFTETSPNSASEQVHVTPKATLDIGTQIQSSTNWKLPPSDKVTVTVTGTTGMDLTAKGSLYWSPTKGAEGATIPRDARKAADLTPITFNKTDFHDGTATKTFDPAQQSTLTDQTGLYATGYWTYVWTISKTDVTGTAPVTWTYHGTNWKKTMDYPVARLLTGTASTITDGWHPSTEQAPMSTVWRLNVTKLAHSGNANGQWHDDKPAAGAVLHLQETTDQTGGTLKPGTADSRITLDQNGRGTFADQTIGVNETRWYRVWESQAPQPMSIPTGNAYWVVKVTQTAGKIGAATVTVTGSSQETSWLIRQQPAGQPSDHTAYGSGWQADPVTWNATLGDTIASSITPPITGDSRDVGRMQLTLAFIGLFAIMLGVALTVARRHATRRR